ncbi:MAG: hypothetical protein RIS64_863, partial [Bacteroidota bacterium]
MNKFNKIEVQILNAFIDNDKGGNPAGVVLNADNLTNEQKLYIANAVGLSETAFLLGARNRVHKFVQTYRILHINSVNCSKSTNLVKMT